MIIIVGTGAGGGILAYEFAKTETKLVEDIDGETGLAVSRVVLGTLYGWEDDIV